VDEERIRDLEVQIEESRRDTERALGTHWAECWLVHPGCARELVAELVAELRTAEGRQVTLDRLVLHLLLESPQVTQGIRPGWLDDELLAEVHRVRGKWATGR
jgi:hypothetical protein